MTLFPLPRRLRSFMGPHTTCLQTAETYAKRSSRGGSSGIPSTVVHQSIINLQIKFLLYFTSGLLTFAALVISAVMCLLVFVWMMLMMRFQYKLTVLLVLMHTRLIDFYHFNKLFVYGLHILLVFVGGFSWISLLFIEL